MVTLLIWIGVIVLLFPIIRDLFAAPPQQGAQCVLDYVALSRELIEDVVEDARAKINDEFYHKFPEVKERTAHEDAEAYSINGSLVIAMYRSIKDNNANVESYCLAVRDELNNLYAEHVPVFECFCNAYADISKKNPDFDVGGMQISFATYLAFLFVGRDQSIAHERLKDIACHFSAFWMLHDWSSDISIEEVFAGKRK